MGPEETKQLAVFRSKLAGARPVLKWIRTGTGKDAPFRAFLDAVQGEVPEIQVKGDDALSPPMPGIRVLKNLVWHAVPEGPELSPFLEAIQYAVSDPPFLPPAASEHLVEPEVPADLAVFIAPGCPFCPMAVRHLMALAFHCEMVFMTVVDGMLFPEASEKAGVRSVPTAVIDGAYRWTGDPPLEEIARVIRQRDPEALGASAFVNLIADGKAGRIAEMMLEKGRIFPAFYDVLTHTEWPVRLGAMVAVEYLAEADPALCASMEGRLWELFEKAGDMVKGDLLQVLGDVGGASTRQRLESVIREAGEDSELKEAAQEAIEKMAERS